MQRVPKGKEIFINIGGTNLFTYYNQVYPNDLQPAPGVKLIISEDINIKVSSDFQPLFGGGGNTGIDLLGAVTRDLTQGRTGFSSQLKQFGFQVWKNSQPISTSLTFKFYMGMAGAYNGKTEVVDPIKCLMALSLPTVTTAGILVPPGPSILNLLTDATDTTVGQQQIISMNIGKIISLDQVVVKAGDPQFSQDVDSDGYPIWGQIAIDIISQFNGSVNDLIRGEV